MGPFIAACLLLISTPGPGVLSTAGVGAGFGFRTGSRYVFGLCIGTNMVALIERPERLAFAAWIDHWHGHHRHVALETQATYHYVRNVVLRPVTPDAPPWAGIVEEVFADDAVTDPMKWYAAGDDPETLKRNMGAMVESVKAFLDLDRLRTATMSEYLLKT